MLDALSRTKRPVRLVSLSDFGDGGRVMPLDVFEPQLHQLIMQDATGEVEDTTDQEIKEILQCAADSSNLRKNEDAWCDVLKSVLKRVLRPQAGSRPLECESIQSVQINPAFLPKGCTDDGEKVVRNMEDFVVGVKPEVEVNTPLSCMKDKHMSNRVLLCGLEVKPSGGDGRKVNLQIMVWTASALIYLEYLRDLPGECTTAFPPVLGCIVVGNVWNFSNSWRKDAGSTTVMGPFRPSNAGTGSEEDLLVLLATWGRVRGWLEKKYYPAYQKLLSEALRKQRKTDIRHRVAFVAVYNMTVLAARIPSAFPVSEPLYRIPLILGSREGPRSMC